GLGRALPGGQNTAARRAMITERNDPGLRSDVAIILLLLLAALLCYASTLTYGLVDLDDPTYVGRNTHVLQGLSWGNAAWAFRSSYASNWHPLTWISLQLDAAIYGRRYGGFHLTNVLLHAAAGAALYLALRRMTGAVGRSALAAALFVVHPLHVESVA